MYAALRQHIEKVVALTDEEFDFVSAQFVIKKFSRRQYLFQEDEPVHYTYFVVKGLLKLTLNDETGNEHILAFAMEDWWESDFQAFYRQSKATMALQCLENTEVLCLSLAGYNNLCSKLPAMVYFFLVKANGGHVSAQQRILSLLKGNATQRYEEFVKRYPSLVQRVPKRLLASYLGVSRETLSRLY
ncbi:Crp/Fnr family transcriptional regulator [uncultured Mucilaginibacter sp.]|uniref:Crp/Fnr family transcriptional regulator n=1 Tax=uncultured Mucilaginibacter sp. TaxID=797541 RepID=UPI0025EE6C55|nr:Crp/Fnr family transcriptional regulator [uncultured Mucilaginibacter sp.]